MALPADPTPEPFPHAPVDALVVGAGAAGLVAAVYLARYRRSLALVGAGDSRLARVAQARNVLGFPDGVPGPDLLARLRGQAARYGVSPVQARVESLARLDGGGFEAVLSDDRRLRARAVVLCTGAQDIEPPVEGLAQGLACGQVRYCPVCDGYETRHQQVAVLGPGAHGLREAVFVAGFENAVTWLSIGSLQAAGPRAADRAAAAGLAIDDRLPQRIACEAGQGVSVLMADGVALRFDSLYPALGQLHACGLATALGARAAEDGQLEVDGHLRTTVPGLYAAGDVAQGLNQVNVAAGQAAIAATALHNDLG